MDNYSIKSSKCEKPLGIKIDNKLNFNTHFYEICKKAGQKLNVLSKVIPYMDLSKQHIRIHFAFHKSVIVHSRGKNNNKSNS